MQALHDWAHRYIDWGFAPVPVQFKGKACKIKNWPDLRSSHDDVAELFQPPCNIGIVLGAPSGGLVDIDLDTSEAIALAPLILPRTGMRFGRESKPSSHWLYRVPAPGKTLQLAGPDGDMLVELRAEGSMTVFPGSIHESGEEVRFDLNDAPGEIEFEELACFIRQLAAAALLLRHWKQGSRHKLALALSGALLTGGMSEDDAHRLFDILITAAADAEHEDRHKCLSDTAQKLHARQAVKGRSDLAEIMGEKATDRVCEWLGLTGASLASRVQVGTALATFGGPVPQSDVANAERFAARHSSKATYCPELKSWLTWDETRWVAGAGGHVMRLGIANGREI